MPGRERRSRKSQVYKRMMAGKVVEEKTPLDYLVDGEEKIKEEKKDSVIKKVKKALKKK